MLLLNWSWEKLNKITKVCDSEKGKRYESLKSTQIILSHPVFVVDLPKPKLDLSQAVIF